MFQVAASLLKAKKIFKEKRKAYKKIFKETNTSLTIKKKVIPHGFEN